MIRVLQSRPLYHGFNQIIFDRLINSSLEEILLYEIGAKRDSFVDNEEITKSVNKKFNYGLIHTVIGITISIILLLTNIFLINQERNNMSEKKDSKITKTASVETKRVIPTVPKEERVQLNEGVKSDKDSKNKK